MTDQLKKGRALVRQKRFQEAELFFEEMVAEQPHDPAPLQELVYVAREQKNYALMLEHLERILRLSPEFLEARILRRRLLAMGGEVSELRDELETFVELAKKDPPTPMAAIQLFRAIQYCCTGSARILHLQTLRSLVKETEENTSLNPRPYKILEAELVLALGDYEEFSKLVNNLSTEKPRTKKIDRLILIAKKCQTPRFPDFSAPKVFGIGLSRTATSSLNDALSILGFHSIHWFNPHSLTLISRDDFLLFDAFTDIPVSYQFEVLYHTFPNAQFIYTTRPIKSWEKSITHHYDVSHGIQSPTELRSPSTTQRFDFAAGHVENNLYGKFDTWSEAFINFDERVQNFFGDKPSSKFLELGICQGEGWEKLCPFLDKPTPLEAFPKANPSPPKHNKG